MKEKLFDKLFNASEEAINERKRDLAKKKVIRNFDSVIDDLENKTIKKEEEIEELARKIVEGEKEAIKDLAKIKLDLEYLSELKERVNDLKEEVV